MLSSFPFRILFRPRSPCVQPLGCRGCPQSPQGCRFHRRRFHPEAGDKGPFAWWVSLSYLEILGVHIKLQNATGNFSNIPQDPLQGFLSAGCRAQSLHQMVPIRDSYLRASQVSPCAWMAGCKVLVRDWMPAPQVLLHLCETRLRSASGMIKSQIPSNDWKQ